MKKKLLLLFLLIPTISIGQVRFDTIFHMEINSDSTDHTIKNYSTQTGNIDYKSINDTLAVFSFTYDNESEDDLYIYVSDMYDYPEYLVYYDKEKWNKIIVYKSTMNTWLYYQRDLRTDNYTRSVFFTSIKK